MAKNKVIYQNWIVEIGYDPQLKEEELNNKYSELSLEQLIESGFDTNSESINESSHKDETIKAVKKAIDKLTPDEQEFIYRFYFMGERYNLLSEKSNRETHKLNALHKQILKKLRISLQSFVKEEFGIETDYESNCPICNSEYRDEINYIIQTRNKRTTWTNVLKRIRNELGLHIKTPQTLIGHEKYHM